MLPSGETASGGAGGKTVRQHGDPGAEREAPSEAPIAGQVPCEQDATE